MQYGYPERSDTMREALARTIDSIGGENVTLRDLIGHLGDHGLLFICVLLCIPFLLPVSIPGVSTVFGLAILLIGIGITLNTTPWIPDRLMDRPLSAEKLKPVLQSGSRWVEKIERVIRPRIGALTTGALMNRINGLAVIAGAVLLMFPLGLVPFSNTLPALAILLLSIGISQRDGAVVLGGYGMLLATVIYFGALAYGAYAAGRGLASLFGG